MKRIAGVYVAWLIACGLLIFAAVDRHPYSFYTLLRWICCAVFVYSAFTAHEKNRVAWTWIFGALAVLYNPIFHVHLDRSTWATVNWFTVAAIAVATAFFWPRDKESTASLSEDKIEISDVSRPAVAREWLIFLASLPLGFATCFFLGYYREEPSDLSRAYDYFWNSHFGLGSVSSLALWLAPYLALMLIRSILWSVNTLWRGRNLKREAFYSFLAVYLIAVVWVGTVAIAELNKARTLRETLDNGAVEKAVFESAEYQQLEKAMAARDSGDRYEQADWPNLLRVAKALVAKYPDSSLAYTKLASVDEQMGFSDDAIAAYQRALKLQPEDALSWNSLALIYKHSGKITQAEFAFSQAIAYQTKQMEQPSSRILRNGNLWTLGTMYRDAGNIDAAKQTYLQAIQEDPSDVLSTIYLIGTYLSEGNENDAFSLAYQMVLRNPNHKIAEAEAWDYLASWYYREHRDSDGYRCSVNAQRLRFRR